MSSFCKHCFLFHNFFLVSSLNSLPVSSSHPFHFLNNWLVPLDTNLLTSTNSIMWFTPSARLKLSGYLSRFSPILVLHVYILAYWVTISQDFHCPTRPTAPPILPVYFLIGCQQLINNQSSQWSNDWESFVNSLCPSGLHEPLASLSASSFFCSCLCNCLLCSFVSCSSLSISVCNFLLSFTSLEMLCVISKSPERRRISAVLLNLSIFPATWSCFLPLRLWWRCFREIGSPIFPFTNFLTGPLRFSTAVLETCISSEHEEFWSLQFAAKLLFISHSLVFDAPSSVVSFSTSHITSPW